MLYPALVVVLIVSSYLAGRRRRLLNRLIQRGVAVLIGVFVVESILGLTADGEAHRIGAHTFVILSLVLLSASIPACVAHSFRSRSFLGFRQVPSGIATVAVAALVTFTGFLRPDGMSLAAGVPDADKPALLRFYVLHTAVVPLVLLTLLLRWYFVLRRTNREVSRPDVDAERTTEPVGDRQDVSDSDAS